MTKAKAKTRKKSKKPAKPDNSYGVAMLAGVILGLLVQRQR